MDSITYLAFDTELETARWIKEFFPDGCKRLPDMALDTASLRDEDLSESDMEQYLRGLSDAFFHTGRTMLELSRLHVPNVPNVYELLKINHTCYTVMEAIDGCDLAQLIREQGGGIPWRKALDIIQQVLMTLASMHRYIYAHRGITLEKIYSCADGRILVTGFEDTVTLDHPLNDLGRCTLMGGRFYAAPEQLSGREQGPWTDVYRVGACLYKLIAGTWPDRDTFIPGTQFPSLSTQNKNIPEWIDSIISKATDPDPEKRFRDAGAMLTAIRFHQQDTGSFRASAIAPDKRPGAGAPAVSFAASEREKRFEEEERYKQAARRNIVGSALAAVSGTIGAVFDGLAALKKRRHSAEKKQVNIDQVQFAAFSNAAVRKKNHYTLKIFVYEKSQNDEMESIKKANSELPQMTKTTVPVPVSRGQQVTVRLYSDAAVIPDPELTLPWEGSVREFAFYYLVPEDADAENLVITANIYINHVIASRLQIMISIHHEAEAPLPVQRSDLVDAFMSYSSSDRKAVLKIAQGMHKARPDLKLFLDVESLRSGENWAPVIDRKINESDVLFLCWSRSAQRSEWVDHEWRYAYRTKGLAFIEPIPLEPPALCQPPEELKDKHFNDIDMMLGLSEEYIENEKNANRS